MRTRYSPAHRKTGALHFHAQKATSAMLEPKWPQYADVMNDYNTSATATHLAALGALRAAPVS